MAFEITIDKDEMPKFSAIINTLFEGFAYIPLKEDKETFTFQIGFLGEDEETICKLQEELMDHLDTINIEEIIGGG